jgi:hypothetical protein
MSQNTEASYTPNMQVTNRYLPLAERIPNPHSDEKRVTNNQHIHDNEVTKKALILCNSHIRYIRTDNFLQSCVVHKYTSYSMSEMDDKLQELDTDYDSIFFHVFTNNIRAETPEVFIQKFESFCQKLRNHCQFAKLIISLPFFSVNDQNLNQKISQCNVLLQYIFLRSSEVDICENSAFSSRGQAIRRFFISDGLHLATQGTSLFVANIANIILAQKNFTYQI